MDKNEEGQQDKWFDLTIKDNILYCKYLQPTVDEKMIDYATKKRLEMVGDNTLPVLSDIRAVKNFTREARQRLSQPDGAINCGKVAVVLNSSIQKVFFNFFNAVFSAPVPTKLFTNFEEAENWIKE